MAKLFTIQTFTGKQIDPFNLKPEDIDIRDIAHALSQMPRFAGHLKHHYSVGLHSLRCFYLALERGVYTDVLLEILLHDAPEYILMDMPSPIKWRLEGYKEAELNVHKVIAEKFGLSCSKETEEKVKRFDLEALDEELSCLMHDIMPMPDWYMDSKEYSMEKVERIFLNQFAIWRRI